MWLVAELRAPLLIGDHGLVDLVLLPRIDGADRCAGGSADRASDNRTDRDADNGTDSRSADTAGKGAAHLLVAVVRGGRHGSLLDGGGAVLCDNLVPDDPGHGVLPRPRREPGPRIAALIPDSGANVVFWHGCVMTERDADDVRRRPFRKSSATHRPPRPQRQATGLSAPRVFANVTGAGGAPTRRHVHGPATMPAWRPGRAEG